MEARGQKSSSCIILPLRSGSGGTLAALGDCSAGASAPTLFLLLIRMFVFSAAPDQLFVELCRVFLIVMIMVELWAGGESIAGCNRPLSLGPRCRIDEELEELSNDE